MESRITKEQLADLYEQHKAGATFEELGRSIGRTRQRIQQLFRKAGYETVSRPRKPERDLARAAGMKELIEQKLLQLGSTTAVAKELGLDLGAVSAICDEHHLWAFRTNGTRDLFSREELVACLREAAAGTALLVAPDYDVFARGRTLASGRPWPTHQTIAQHFGGWAAAKQAAGLAVSPRFRPPGRWSSETSPAAVASVWAKLGHPPTLDEYRAAYREAAGELPCVSTVQKTVSTRWPEVIVAAGAHLPGGLAAWMRQAANAPREDDPAPTAAGVAPAGLAPVEPAPEPAPARLVPQGEHRVFDRRVAVKDWVREQAAGRCEACGSDAPFLDRSGVPFLEVHHVQPLADGGADSVENAVALCPNCHRAMHHASDAGARREALVARVPRLSSHVLPERAA